MEQNLIETMKIMADSGRINTVDEESPEQSVQLQNYEKVDDDADNNDHQDDGGFLRAQAYGDEDDNHQQSE